MIRKVVLAGKDTLAGNIAQSLQEGTRFGSSIGIHRLALIGCGTGSPRRSAAGTRAACPRAAPATSAAPQRRELLRDLLYLLLKLGGRSSGSQLLKLLLKLLQLCLKLLPLLLDRLWRRRLTRDRLCLLWRGGLSERACRCA